MRLVGTELTALIVSILIAWPVAVIGWSLPDKVFDMHKLKYAPKGPLLIVCSLPTLATLWAIVTVPAFALPGTLVMGWTLITLAVIDARTYVLPDCLTLPLIAGGVFHTVLINTSDFTGPEDRLPAMLDSILAAALGYAFMASTALVFKRLRGKEGLGLGDAKLLAGAGAWFGISALPTVVLLAALSALVITLLMDILTGARRFRGAIPLPFGPYLAAGTWIVGLYGPIALS